MVSKISHRVIVGPTGQPLAYEPDEDFQPVEKGGRCLDPVAAKAAAEAVANQGKK